jgi:hypothetical protein
MAAEQAAWCLLTGQSVQTYLTLTRLERHEFVKLAAKMRR